LASRKDEGERGGTEKIESTRLDDVIGCARVGRLTGRATDPRRSVPDDPESPRPASSGMLLLLLLPAALLFHRYSVVGAAGPERSP